MRKLRIGLFVRDTSPKDGGADTLLRLISVRTNRLQAASYELVPVPWSAWSHRRRPLRYLWSHLVRTWGGEIPLVDLRPVCRRYALDAAYFSAPAFVHLDLPFIYSQWDVGHRSIPDFPEMRCGRDPWTQREAQCRRMLGQASYILVGNEAGAAELREMFGVAASKLVVLPFPNPDFTTIEAAMPVWCPRGPFFLYPAQFWPHKNHHTLLLAIARLARRAGPSPELVFVGDDKGNSSHLRAAAAELGLTNRVRFMGFVPRGELKALYQAATALVFPSLLGPNNLPPQEAAVLGCPMVLSDLPGHREQLGEGALYARPLAAAEWAAAMEHMLTDAALRTTLVARAKTAVARYTVEAYGARLDSLFSELAARRQLWGR
jgi:glycosyltransferase involved in cell wall biosynthesis